MDLRVQREVVARQAVDHPRPEERAVAIEHRLVQVGDEAQCIVVRRTLWQRQVLNVVVRIV